MADYIADEQLEFLATEVTHFTINKWIVQMIVKDKWYTAYHSVPQSGTPKVLYGSVREAFTAVLIQAMNDFHSQT